MGGGPVFRSLAALGTLGLSETAQKKPFQDLGGDNPVNSTAGGPLRFIPGGAQIAAVMGMGTDSMVPDKPNLTTMPVLGQQTPTDTTGQQKEAQAAEAERLRAGRGKASTILTSPDDQGSTPRLKRYLGGY